MRAIMTAAVLLAAAVAVPAAAQTEPAPQAGAPQAPSSPAGGGYGGRAHGGPPSPEMRAARRAVREQCAADIARLCPDAAQAEAAPPTAEAPGAGRRAGGMFQCVRQHVSELSPGCRQSLDAMRAARRPAPDTAAAPQG